MTKSAPRTAATEPANGNERLRAAESLAGRLDKPMGIPGVIFLFVVLGQLTATEPAMVRVFTAAGGCSGQCLLLNFSCGPTSPALAKCFGGGTGGR